MEAGKYRILFESFWVNNAVLTFLIMSHYISTSILILKTHFNTAKLQTIVEFDDSIRGNVNYQKGKKFSFELADFCVWRSTVERGSEQLHRNKN